MMLFLNLLISIQIMQMLDISSFVAIVSAIATLVTAIIAYFALKQSNRMLEIEQKPYVVLEGVVARNNDKIKLSIKNIGRGSAINININGSLNNQEKPLLHNDTPNAYYLYSGEDKEIKISNWDEIEKVEKKQKFLYYIYITYEDQTGKVYKCRAELENVHPSDYILKVMRNCSI